MILVGGGGGGGGGGWGFVDFIPVFLLIIGADVVETRTGRVSLQLPRRRVAPVALAPVVVRLERRQTVRGGGVINIIIVVVVVVGGGAAAVAAPIIS